MHMLRTTKIMKVMRIFDVEMKEKAIPLNVAWSVC